MKTRQFVFELGCEELPTSVLPSLNQQFQELFPGHYNLNWL